MNNDLFIEHSDSVTGVHAEAVENALGFGLQFGFNTARIVSVFVMDSPPRPDCTPPGVRSQANHVSWLIASQYDRMARSAS